MLPTWPSLQQSLSINNTSTIKDHPIYNGFPVNCPRCQTSMQEQTLDGHMGRSLAVDICRACQSFWFDAHESVNLTPGSTLQLFKLIGEHVTRPQRTNADLSKCPR